MKFALFPPEILAQVLQFPNSRLILKLWLCGNRSLQSKLVSATSDIDLKAIRGSARTIPQMVLHLTKLRRLCISSDRELLRDQLRWYEFIEALPKTIERLELLSIDAFNLFSPKEGASPNTPLVDLHTRLPHLQLLRLDLNTSTSRGFTQFLPPTLTVLHCTLLLDYTVVEGNRVAHLPRSLSELRGTTHIMAKSKHSIAADWKAAPPSLENGGDIYFDQYSPTSFKWLPQSLRRVYFDPSIAPWTTKTLRSLPPLLKTLELSIAPNIQIDAKWMACLPTTLEFLGIRFHEPSALATSLVHLPRSLTQLDLSGASPTLDFNVLHAEIASIGVANFWPPNLGEVRFGSDIIGPEHIKLLPQTLHSLTFGLSVPTDAELEDINLHQFVDPQLFPQALKTLLMDLTNLASFEEKPIPSLARLTPSEGPPMLKSLPSSLETLHLDLSLPLLTNTLHSKMIPQGLADLSLYNGACEMFEFLPRSLTKLMIYHLLDVQTSAKIKSGSFFAGLPSTLQYLTLNVLESDLKPCALPAEPLSTMLPHLRILRVRSSAAFFPSRFIRELPTLLEDLSICIPQIDKKDAPFLPQHLHKCEIRSLSWYECPYMAEYWPLRCIFDIPYFAGDFRKKAQARLKFELLP